MQATPHRARACLCVCAAHTLVMVRNDTVIAVVFPPLSILVLLGQDLKRVWENIFLCVWVCASRLSYVCLSLPRHHSLQRPTERTETAQSTRVNTHIRTLYTHIHPRAEPVILKLHFLMDFEYAISLLIFWPSVNTTRLIQVMKAWFQFTHTNSISTAEIHNAAGGFFLGWCKYNLASSQKLTPTLTNFLNTFFTKRLWLMFYSFLRGSRGDMHH